MKLHELPDCKIGERTVRQNVHHRKIALGMMVRETCVPQSYAWGVEAQVDWYEAYADLAGEGEPYTGLKSSGRDLGPAIPAADKAIEDGSVGPLMKLMADASEAGIRELFQKVLARKSFCGKGPPRRDLST
jgi:hypothetical protein